MRKLTKNGDDYYAEEKWIFFSLQRHNILHKMRKKVYIRFVKFFPAILLFFHRLQIYIIIIKIFIIRDYDIFCEKISLSLYPFLLPFSFSFWCLKKFLSINSQFRKMKQDCKRRNVSLCNIMYFLFFYFVIYKTPRISFLFFRCEIILLALHKSNSFV